MNEILDQLFARLPEQAQHSAPARLLALGTNWSNRVSPQSSTSDDKDETELDLHASFDVNAWHSDLVSTFADWLDSEASEDVLTAY